MKKLILFLIGLWWWLSKPGKRRAQVKDWRGNFAHRGLHDEVSPENSPGAFLKAIEAGLGFECDVQLTKDGELVIHHDFDGTRSLGLPSRIDETTLAELKTKKLFGSDETIMTLPQLLDLVQGQVPIILEIKAEKEYQTMSRLTAEVLDDYSGPLVVESFHPLVLWWFRRHRPKVIRGQLSWNSFRREKPSLMNFLLTNYLLNFLSRPDFVAHAKEDAKDLGLVLQQKLFRTHSVVYTVTSEEEAEELGQFQAVIFEDYRPK